MLREHMVKMCTSLAAHHVRMAKIYGAQDGALNKELAGAHADHAEQCLSMCKALAADVDTHDDSRGVPSGKAVPGSPMRLAQDLEENLNKLAPPSARAVMPDVPTATLVPRYGSAPISTKGVDPQFQHLVSE